MVKAVAKDAASTTDRDLTVKAVAKDAASTTRVPATHLSNPILILFHISHPRVHPYRDLIVKAVAKDAARTTIVPPRFLFILDTSWGIKKELKQVVMLNTW